MANNPIALDFNDLIYYDTKIKKYVDDKADLIISNIPDTYTKDEIDEKISSAYKADLKELDSRIDTIAEQLASNTTNIISHREELDDIEAHLIRLDAKDDSLDTEIKQLIDVLGTKASISDIPSLEGYATEEFVRAKIAEAEFGDKDIDLSDYYTKAEADAAIKAAIDAIPETDVSAFVTKEEFQRVADQSAANNKLIFDIDSELYDVKETLKTIPTKISQLENDLGFITEIPEEYVTDDELRDAINSIDFPEVDLTAYYTKEETDALIPKDYVKEETLANYATHDELEQSVTEIVDEHFEETVISHVDKEIDKKLAEVQTINYGTW